MFLVERHALLCTTNITDDDDLIPPAATFTIWPLVLAATVILNASTIALIVKTKALLRNIVYQFMISRHAANIAFGIVHTADDLIAETSSKSFTCTYLPAAYFFEVATIMSGVLSIFMLALLRMRKLKISASNNFVITRKSGYKSLACCVSAWLVSLVTSLIPILTQERRITGLPYIASLVFIVATLLLNLRLLLRVKQHAKGPGIKTARRLQRTERMIVLSGLLLLVTWLPYTAAAMLENVLSMSREKHVVLRALRCIGILQPLLDPLIVIALTNDMKKKLISSLHRAPTVRHDTLENNASTIGGEIDVQLRNRSRQSTNFHGKQERSIADRKKKRPASR